MADNRVQQPTQAELSTQIAELQAKVHRLAELSSKNQNGKNVEGDPKGSNSSNAQHNSTEPHETIPPKEKLTLDNLFSEGVMSFQMLKNFVLPAGLKLYEGFGDPRVHIKKFQSMIFFNGAFDLVLCRSFSTYLDSAALLWFSKVPAGSITCFEELARSFIDYFAASRIYVHGSDYLSTIKQGPQESLKDYMTRFAKATMEIPDLDPKVHLHVLKNGLRPGKFQVMIVVTKPKTLEKFHERAAGQMEIEELREARRVDKQTHRRDEEKSSKSTRDRHFKRPFKLNPKFDTYTKFNTKRENIIKEILHAKLIKPPTREGNYQDQRFVDRSKHCSFHQKYEHTTYECVVAKDRLERLARQGLLDNYIEGRKTKEASSG
ncbi:uncharacterized protein [Arachis hypogaea]|uniref:uncharacterized protein n=1 Tax=Arachis hypogaea TaxID=3818 RepID=UPI000DECAF5B|nr:uncharacterized protein LOC112726878 [Arachis hypogaea]